MNKCFALFKSDMGPGLILFLVLILALIVANSPLAAHYDNFRNIPIHLGIGKIDIHKPLLLWINEGLMAIFFFVITLEMKQEVVQGNLSSWSQATLPLMSALGGIILPAIIYLFITNGHPHTSRGWPIPTTTDIAFSLGALVLMGKKAPSSLRSFLIALSIVDDILAIILIAFMYSDKLSWRAISLSLIAILGLSMLNRMKTKRIAPYVLWGIFLWFCLSKSGIHATLAGVIVALAIPIPTVLMTREPAYHHTRKTLEPWVNYFILPIFVFCNGGLPFTEFSYASITSPVSLGIILGLWVGKTIGIFLVASWLIRLKWVSRPRESTPIQLLGVSAFAGIGFTMSLFLASLAFNFTDYETLTRQGVLLGSLLSFLTGLIIFWFFSSRKKLVDPI